MRLGGCTKSFPDRDSSQRLYRTVLPCAIFLFRDQFSCPGILFHVAQAIYQEIDFVRRNVFSTLSEGFSALRERFSARIKGFLALRKHFPVLKIHFSALKKDFSALIEEFSAVIGGFSAVREAFLALGECFFAVRKH